MSIGTHAVIGSGPAASEHRSQWLAYVLAVVLSVATLIARMGMGVAFGDRPMLILFHLPIIISAYMGGLGPGLVATAAAAVLVDYFLIPPTYTLRFAYTYDFVMWGILIVNGVLISVLSETLYRSRRHAEISRLQHEKSEERFSRAMEAISDGLWDWDVATGNVYFSPGYFSMLGYEPEEFPAKPDAWLEMVHPDDRKRALAVEEACIRNDVPAFGVEFRMLSHDGTWRWILRRGKVIIRNADGRALRMVGTHIDMTERKQAEEALRESEAIYRTLVENIPQKVFMKDTNSCYVSINEHLARDFGIRPADVFGKTDYDFFPRKLADKYRANDKRIMKTGATEELEVHNLSPGKEEWVKTFKTPVRDVNGKIIGVFGIFWDITERKLSEEALSLRESYLTAILENQPGLVWLKDKEGRFLAVNHTFARSCGMERSEEVLGKTDLDIWPRELAEKYRNDDKAVLTTGTPIAVEEAISDRGEMKWFETFKTPVLDKDGQILGTSGYARDITERKNAAKALHESELRLRTIFQTTNEGFWLIDNDTVTTDLNPRMCAILGRNREEVFGKKIFDFVDSENKAIFEQQMRLRAQGEVGAYEIALSRPDGSNVLCQFNATPLFDESGNKVGSFAMVTDISERKRAEIALRMSEERFSKIFRASPVGTSITRLSDDQCVDINDALLRLLGYTREEVIGQNVLKMGVWANPGDRAEVIEVLQEQGSIRDFETQLVSKSGEIIDVLGSAEVIEMAEERYMLSLAHDITERKRGEKEKKRLEEQLFQAQKIESVGRLAGGVAHDFNNMLGVIIGRAEMALQQDVSNDKLQHHLDEILKAGLRSADLTRQLLAFARKQTAVAKILDLNDTISGMLQMLRRLIGEDIDLLWGPELDLWKVKIDPSQVDQVLANLVVNARDAISGVGAVTIRTENVVIDDSNKAKAQELIPGDYVLLTVSDTGEGMSQEIRENIFEPFFTTKELGKGTGLGLSTVYGVVKQNDGFIYVESEQGKGTTFKIYLPRFEAETTQVPSEEITIKRLTGTETILLVEDDEAILDLGKMILENLGYTVLAARTPVDAFNLVDEHPRDIHLLITDVVMPEMNGRELAEKLSAIRPNLKCLYMSGYTADVVAHRGILDAGVNFIQKPFRSDDIAARVREVLDHLE
ncbi:MAG: PAS domain S-box protein [Syntrophobacteraceae bacterium]